MGKKLGKLNHLPKVPVLSAKELARTIAAVSPHNAPKPLAVIASLADTPMAVLQVSATQHPEVVCIDSARLWSLTERGLKLAR